jgi:WD40 repeat protein
VVVLLVFACSPQRDDKPSPRREDVVPMKTVPPIPGDAAVASGAIEPTMYGAPSKDAHIDRIQMSANGRVALVIKPGAPPTRVELEATGTRAKLVELTAITDVEDLAMSPDGRTLALVRHEGVTLVKGNAAPVPVKLPADHAPARATFAANGNLIVLAVDDTGYRVIAFDAKHAWRSDQRVYLGPDEHRCTLATSSLPDVLVIENCYGTRLLRVHDAAVLAEVSQPARTQSAGFAEVARGQFAMAFVVDSNESAFQVWQLDRLAGPPMKVSGPCAIAPTGKLAACVRDANEVVVFEPMTLAVRMRVHVPERASALRFTPDGSRLVMGIYDTRIAIADTSTVHEAAPALAVGPAAFAIDPAKPTMLDAPKRKLASRTIEIGDGPTSIVPSPDAKRVAVVTAKLRGRIYELARPASPIELFDLPDDGHRPELAWSPDGTRIADVEWDPKERLVVRSASGRDGELHAAEADIEKARIAWSSKGVIATGGPSRNTIQIWNPDGPAKTRQLESSNKQPLAGVAFAPDGRMVSWGDMAPTIVWHADTGAQLRELGGHDRSAAWSRDGKLLVTHNFDRAIVIWDGAKLEPRAVVRGADVFALAISPDGKRLAGSDTDGITIWSLPDGKPLYRIDQRIAAPKVLAWPGPLVVGADRGLTLFTP